MYLRRQRLIDGEAPSMHSRCYFRTPLNQKLGLAMGSHQEANSRRRVFSSASMRPHIKSQS